MRHGGANWIIWDPTGTLATGLRCAARRVHADELVKQMRERRKAGECDALLDESPFSFVTVGVDSSNFVAALDWLASLERRHPAARSAAVVANGLEKHAWALAEAGAVYVGGSLAGWPACVRLAERHIARVPRPELSFEDWVAAELPWSPLGQRNEIDG